MMPAVGRCILVVVVGGSGGGHNSFVVSHFFVHGGFSFPVASVVFCRWCCLYVRHVNHPQVFYHQLGCSEYFCARAVPFGGLALVSTPAARPTAAADANQLSISTFFSLCVPVVGLIGPRRPPPPLPFPFSLLVRYFALHRRANTCTA